jgi:hypothetical protein
VELGALHCKSGSTLYKHMFGFFQIYSSYLEGSKYKFRDIWISSRKTNSCLAETEFMFWSVLGELGGAIWNNPNISLETGLQCRRHFYHFLVTAGSPEGGEWGRIIPMGANVGDLAHNRSAHFRQKFCFSQHCEFHLGPVISAWFTLC